MGLEHTAVIRNIDTAIKFFAYSPTHMLKFYGSMSLAYSAVF